MASHALIPRRNGAVKGAPRHSSDFVASEKDPVTSFLGWFSLGLGIAELFAPGFVARIVGIDDEEHERLLRAYGVRELAAGIGILTRPKPTYWMWNRVLGDAIDLASLRRAMNNEENNRAKLIMATLAVAGVTALDIASSIKLTSEASPAAGHDAGSFQADTVADDHLVLTSTVTVNRPIEAVYEFWKDPQNYAHFMDHLEEEVKVVADTPNEMIRWRSTAMSKLSNSGTVTFRRAAGGRGTIVKLVVEYRPRGGALGVRIGKVLSTIPKTQLSQDLRRFKQLMEIGEVVQSDATAGRGTPHPAKPSRSPRHFEQEVRV